MAIIQTNKHQKYKYQETPYAKYFSITKKILKSMIYFLGNMTLILFPYKYL